ncbi:MAG: ATP-dependent Clp protease adaptor ClpS [Acidobacteria bacterium]|nr:ATP-dependent Clp protease adaptor ClpS [Acidobacteriota bacterium]
MPPSSPAAADPSSGVLIEPRPELERTPPRSWRVLLHNDDYTTQEFVVWVLETVFAKTATEAMTIMLHVHHAGVGVAGIYTKEIAETKVAATERLAEQHEYPLRVSMEPEPEEGKP